MAELTLTLRAINEAKGALEEAERQLKGLGDAAQDAQQQASGEKGGGWRQTVKDVRDVSLALQGTIGIAKNFADAVGEVVDRGNQVQNTTRAFNAYVDMLGEDVPGALNAMRDSTAGMLSDFDLMQAGNRYAAMGLASTTEEMAQLTEIATVLGGAMGKGPQAAIEEFSLMLANKSIPRLDTFGISASRVRERMEELKAAGMDADAAFRLAVIEDAAPKLEAMGGAAEIAGAGIAKLGARLQNLGDQVTVVISSVVNQAATALDQLIQLGELIFNPAIRIEPQIDADLRGEIEAQLSGAGESAISIKAKLDDPSLQTIITTLETAGYPDATIAAIISDPDTETLKTILADLPAADIYTVIHDQELSDLVTRLSGRFGEATIAAVLEDPTLATIINAIDEKNASGAWSDAEIEALITASGFSNVVAQISAYTGWPAAQVGAEIAEGGLTALGREIAAGEYDPATTSIILAPDAANKLNMDVAEIENRASVTEVSVDDAAKAAAVAAISSITAPATVTVDADVAGATTTLSTLFDAPKIVNVDVPTRYKKLFDPAGGQVGTGVIDIEIGNDAFSTTPAVLAATNNASIGTATIAVDSSDPSGVVKIIESARSGGITGTASISVTANDPLTPILNAAVAGAAAQISIDTTGDISALDTIEMLHTSSGEFPLNIKVQGDLPAFLQQEAAVLEPRNVPIAIAFDETPINELEQRLYSIEELAGKGIIIDAIVQFERVNEAIQQLREATGDVNVVVTLEDKQSALMQLQTADEQRDIEMRVRATGQEAVIELLDGKTIPIDAYFGEATTQQVLELAASLGGSIGQNVQKNLAQGIDMSGINIKGDFGEELKAEITTQLGGDGIPVGVILASGGGIEMLTQFSDLIGVPQVEIETTFNTATVQKTMDEVGEETVMAVNAALGNPEEMARSLLNLDMDPLQIQAIIGGEGVTVEDLDAAAANVAAGLKDALPPVAFEAVASGESVAALQQQFVDAGVQVPLGLDVANITAGMREQGFSEITIAAYIEQQSVETMRQQMIEAGVDDKIIDVTLAGGATEQARELAGQLITAANEAERLERASQGISEALGGTDASGLARDLEEAFSFIQDEQTQIDLKLGLGTTTDAQVAFDEMMANVQNIAATEGEGAAVEFAMALKPALETGTMSADVIEAVNAAIGEGGLEAGVDILVNFTTGAGGEDGAEVKPFAPEATGITETQAAVDMAVSTMTTAVIDWGPDATNITATEVTAHNIVNLLTTIPPLNLGLDAQLEKARQISNELARPITKEVNIVEKSGSTEYSGSFP